jgi:PQQ-like domain
MSIDRLVFVGLNGYALALDRNTGEIVWSNSEMHSGYVTLLLDGDRLIASTNGYMYCLDPLTGKVLWHNPLRGYGVGAPRPSSRPGGSLRRSRSSRPPTRPPARVTPPSRHEAPAPGTKRVARTSPGRDASGLCRRSVRRMA